MNKTILTAVLAAACLCPTPGEGVKAEVGESFITITNDCNRPIHVLAESGTYVAGTTHAKGSTQTIKTTVGKKYTVQVFDVVPSIPHDWKSDVAHDAVLKVSVGGFLNMGCVFN